MVLVALLDNWEFLPKGGVATCVSRATGVLRNAPEINEEVIRQAVWVGAGQPDDDETKAKFDRSEEHTSELQSLMRISYAVFCLQKKKHTNNNIYPAKQQYSTNATEIKLADE